MLLEGMLATFVVVACAGGIALGFAKGGETFTGAAAFTQHYSSWVGGTGLGNRLSPVIVGSANMIQAIGIPKQIALTIMGVFIASFAATTMDTATRLQRYVVAELVTACGIPAAAKRHPATLIAVVTALILAFSTGASGVGALTLWPLFGATNQLLAGLALLVITIYLAHKKSPVVYTMIPMIFMIVMTGWAMIINLTNFYAGSKWLLFCIGLCTIALEIWMIIESIAVFRKVYGEEDIAAAELR
jgi:carbon starvation protein